MFVEIARLFIVVFATMAGFAVARNGAAVPGNGAIVGATLGACLGYVAGGVIGRQLGSLVGVVERRAQQAPAARLLAGAIGASAAGGLAALVLVPLAVLLPGRWGWPAGGLLVWLAVYAGYRVAVTNSDELFALAGLSTRPLGWAPVHGERMAEACLVDTSAVIDGRLLAVARAGFLPGPLLVARFVLDELLGIADASDPVRRRKGRRGLEVLDALRRHPGTLVQVLDDEVPEFDDVDAKLVALARRLGTGLLTVDIALQRSAELQGVRCLNLGRLSDGVRPAHVPGEVVRLPLTREGKEPGQGVGFLDDGTMVVVTGAAGLVGQEVEVRVSSVVQTSLGPMLFAALAGR